MNFDGVSFSMPTNSGCFNPTMRSTSDPSFNYKIVSNNQRVDEVNLFNEFSINNGEFWEKGDSLFDNNENIKTRKVKSGHSKKGCLNKKQLPKSISDRLVKKQYVDDETQKSRPNPGSIEKHTKSMQLNKMLSSKALTTNSDEKSLEEDGQGLAGKEGQDLSKSLSRIGFNSSSLGDLKEVKSTFYGNFNGRVVAHIRKNIKNCKTVVTAEGIEEIVSFVLLKGSDSFLNQREQSNLFSASLMAPNFFQYQYMKCAHSLLMVQRGGELFKRIGKRLCAIKTDLFHYLNKKGRKTQWSGKLIETLDLLLKEDDYSNLGIKNGKDLLHFLKTIDGIENERTREVVMLGLGSERKESQKVLECLREWSAPTVELFKKMGGESSENEHLWIHNEESVSLMRDMPGSEVLNSLAFGNRMTPKSIAINEEFYCEAEDINNDKFLQKDFLYQLLSAIYQSGINPEMKEEIIKQEVEKLTSTKKPDAGINKEIEKGEGKRKKKKRARKEGEKIFTAEEKPGLASGPKNASVLCLDLLKLCTMSAWGYGHNFFEKKCPVLFGKQYFPRLDPGVDISIQILGPDIFFVKQSRIYTIYPHLKINNFYPKPDRERPLVKIPVSCIQFPLSGKWVGILILPKSEELSFTKYAEFSDKLEISNEISPSDVVIQGIPQTAGRRIQKSNRNSWLFFSS